MRGTGDRFRLPRFFVIYASRYYNLRPAGSPAVIKLLFIMTQIDLCMFCGHLRPCLLSRQMAAKRVLLFLSFMLVFAHSASAQGKYFWAEIGGRRIYCEITSDTTVEVQQHFYADRFRSEYCGNLIIPSTVTYYRKYTVTGIQMWECPYLTSIFIPRTSIDIPTNCNSLNTIIVEEGNPVYDSREDCNAIIETATNTLILGCKNTVIPHSVVAIGRSAFNKNNSITDITIPASVHSIGSLAFQSCDSLSSIVFEGDVKSIEGGAFYACRRLSSVVFNGDVNSIGNSAFYECTNLTTVDFKGNIESIGNSAFHSCSRLPSIVFKGDVGSIGDNAFSYCKKLTSVIFEGDLRNIGYEAFSYCINLTSIIFKGYVGVIGRSTFFGCDKLYQENIRRIQ